MQSSIQVYGLTNEHSPKEVPHKFFKFSGGEVQVRLEGPVGPGCAIHADLWSSDAIMELLMVTDAVRVQSMARFGGEIPIDLVAHYFPYARQDRPCAPGEALGARVMCDLINSQNYESVEVWDAHSSVVPALLRHCVNVHCAEFVYGIGSYDGLVSPDTGATAKVGECAKRMSLPVMEALKHRNPATGELTGTALNPYTVRSLSALPSPRLLIVDDICDGGRTFVELAKVLKKAFKDPVIDLYVTHGIFSQGLAVFHGLIGKVYCANPFPGTMNMTSESIPGIIKVTKSGNSRFGL